ncbi:MAG: hypothetical protein JW863_03510 [Chitinispirillaceae bacterium]|nr:hypothetical protein [Chitinispirillaceae bacterium]
MHRTTRMLPGILLLSVFMNIPVHALDEVSLLAEDELNKSTVMAIDTFTPAEKSEKVHDQSRYLDQLRETLLYALKSMGYYTTDGIDSSSPPDLVLKVAFTEIDNKGASMNITLSLTVNSYKTGKPVLRIKNRQSAYASDLKDEMKNLTDEQGLEIIRYFRERKKKKTTEKPSTVGLTCDKLAHSKMAFCVLHTPEIRVTANIIGVELQKWSQKKKIPLTKIDYGIDTAFQRIYAEQTEDVTYDALPAEIQSSLAKGNVDYCLLLYNFKDGTPGGRKKRKAVSVGVVPAPLSGGVGFGVIIGGSGNDQLGKANQFNNIYCRFSFIDVGENRALLHDDFWADREECDDEVVQCIVDRTKEALSEGGGGKGKKKRCWR